MKILNHGHRRHRGERRQRLQNPRIRRICSPPPRHAPAGTLQQSAARRPRVPPLSTVHVNRRAKASNRALRVCGLINSIGRHKLLSGISDHPLGNATSCLVVSFQCRSRGITKTLSASREPTTTNVQHSASHLLHACSSANFSLSSPRSLKSSTTLEMLILSETRVPTRSQIALKQRSTS